MVVAPARNAGDLVVAVGLLALMAVRWRWATGGPAGAVVLALAAWVHFVVPTVGVAHGWNLYHYTVGARFFGELGYHDLYAATLAADRAGDDSLAPVTTVRDLRTYERVPRAELEVTYVLEDHLAPERIAELQRMVDALEPLVPDRTWPRVFQDRGYVATPPYTAVAARVAAALPVERPLARHLSTALDPALLLLGFGAVLAVYGLEATATVALLMALFPGTEARLVGGFLQYDWLAALLVAAAAVRSERPVAAAVALSWAAASRVFPVFLAVSLLLPAARRALRREPLSPFDRRFVLAFVGASALWLLLGCLTARGPAAWLEFVPRILHHAAMHVRGQGNLGLQHLLAFSPFVGSEEVREAVIASRAPLWWACAAVGLAGWGWIAARRPREEALELGWVPVFLLTVVSQYYWVGLALAVLGTSAARGRAVALAFAAVFTLGHVSRWAGPPPYVSFVLVEATLAAMLALWLLTAERAEG